MDQEPRILRQGDHGTDVEQLQLRLKAAGYYRGEIDGDFGKQTHDAVLAFQEDRPDLGDDAEAGPMTMAALDAAITKKPPSPPAAVPSAVPCEATTWSAFQKFISAVTAHPVRYGPGRGLWHDGKFTVTCGPGALGLTSWRNALGKPYASFHCTSWTNVFLSWLERRNEDFTHAGNIPSLFTLLESGPELHQNPGAGPYRGFGNVCSPIAPDGSSVTRSGVPKVIDAKELLWRRASLPTFMAFCQSTKRSTGWLWWHHTGIFVVDHNDGHRLYRIAADGYKGQNGYSGDPMRLTEVTDKTVGNLANAVYRIYGVNTADGTYGDKTRPIAEIDFEM